jgi:hypothetical protein
MLAFEASALLEYPIIDAVELPRIINPFDDIAKTECEVPLYGKLNPIGKLPLPRSSPILDAPVKSVPVIEL